MANNLRFYRNQQFGRQKVQVFRLDDGKRQAGRFFGLPRSIHDRFTAVSAMTLEAARKLWWKHERFLVYLTSFSTMTISFFECFLKLRMSSFVLF
jgi:hypothetical protein